MWRHGAQWRYAESELTGCNPKSKAPSKENAGMAVATRPATVTCVVRSAGVPRLVWKHLTDVPEAHAAVWHAPSATCTVGVVSTELVSVY